MITQSLRFAALICCLAVLMAGAAPATAADYSLWRRPPPVREAGPVLPFPRSERAQAIWASAACWAPCQSVCTDALDRCLRESPDQARCLAAADTCDRICQSGCRQGGELGGGPLIAPIPP